MVDHTTSRGFDHSLRQLAGHRAWTVYVYETKDEGLHCHDCGWYGGSFKGRWAEKHKEQAWEQHLTFVEAGGVIEHGVAENVRQKVCECVTCKIAWREEEYGPKKAATGATGPKPLTACARCGQPLADDNCPDVCSCSTAPYPEKPEAGRG